MWDAVSNTFQDGPAPGHRSTFDVDRRTYVFGCFPHGPIPVAAAVLRPQLAQWDWLSKKLRMGVASAVFWLPIVRDFYLWFGSVHADKRTMLGQLSAGNSVILLPGGIKEQLTNCGPHEDVVVLKHRKGFVRLALETGSPLVPVYCFGERRAYVPQRGLLHAASRALKRLLNIGAPAVRGRWFTLMPLPVPLTLVVGAPIEVPAQFAVPPKGAAAVSAAPPVEVPEASKDAMSLEDAVDAMHARFCAALQQLYDEHKDACGYKDVALVIR